MSTGVCSICGNEFSGAMEFCPVCMLREAPAGGWSDISFEGKPQFTIRPEVAKVPRRRFIDLQPNAIEWLKLCLPNGGFLPSTRIIEGESHVIRDKRTKQRERLGIRLPKNGLRHTFCSCWLAMWEDENKLRMQTGHKNAATLHEHYNKGTKKAEAERFWSIMPPEQKERKIVAFSA
jgi:integrase